MPGFRIALRTMLMASALAGGAAAQAQGGVIAFPAAHFAEARPADAYDMIRRLPGFTLIEGDEDVRGLAGARGNVLFNGRAPSGKQESLAALLRRIPAASVERIELIRGGAGGIDMAGYDVVANVVRVQASRARAAIEAGAATASDGNVRPNLSIEGSRQSGATRIEGALALTTEVDDDSGHGTIVETDADGAVTGVEQRRAWEVERVLSASGEYQTALAGGEITANANVGRERTTEAVLSDGELSAERETLWRGEIGGRYVRDAGGGRIEAVILQRAGWLRGVAEQEDERFSEATNTRESIARVDYRRERGRLSFNAGIEGALNRLDSAAALEQGGVTLPLPGSAVEVSERRAEAVAGLSWRPRTGLTIEPSLRTELSSIRAEGDLAAQHLSFLYWKPRLAASLSRGSSQVRLVVERSVGQLDFNDFVASASLDRGEVSAGAAALRPPRTWSAAATFEQRFWEDGALILSYRYERIDDVIDRVAVVSDDGIFDAVGNIGRGTRHVGRAELTLPFARLGLPGLQLRGALTLLHSRVTDPETGQRRIISKDRPVEGEIGIVHDLPGGRWSWGADLSLAHRESQFRFDQVRTERKGIALGVYVEFRPAAAWRLRLEAANLTGRTLSEVREDHDGPRALGPVQSLETLRIDTTPIFMFSVRRSFGG
ncbi:MAG: hypothetical protein KF780_03980 [Sphingomonas sp.]|nr:hypothetical protein [Sphingomonas sp.]